MIRTAAAVALMALSPALPVRGPQPHLADAVCADHEALLSSLAHQYRESPREIGLAGDGSVVELTTTTDGRTWTLLVTRPDGSTCIIAAGEAWKEAPQSEAGLPL